MYYSNGFENSYEELITFYPVFYRDVFEMRAILETHGRIADNCVNSINNIIENCFISSANESMISRLEAFLQIKVDKNSSLEERRNVVHSYFIGTGKLSASKLQEIIRAFTGADSKITFNERDVAGNCILTIEMARGGNAINYDTILDVLARKIPAHIAYKMYVKYSHPVGISKTTEKNTYEFRLCGLEPEVATLGDKNYSETVTETDAAAMSYGVNYNYCGTAVAGTL